MGAPAPAQAVLNAAYDNTTNPGTPQLATTVVKTSSSPSTVGGAAYSENAIWGFVLATDGAHLRVVVV